MPRSSLGKVGCAMEGRGSEDSVLIEVHRASSLLYEDELLPSQAATDTISKKLKKKTKKPRDLDESGTSGVEAASHRSVTVTTLNTGTVPEEDQVDAHKPKKKKRRSSPQKTSPHTPSTHTAPIDTEEEVVVEKERNKQKMDTVKEREPSVAGETQHDGQIALTEEKRSEKKKKKQTLDITDPDLTDLLVPEGTRSSKKPKKRRTEPEELAVMVLSEPSTLDSETAKGGERGECQVKKKKMNKLHEQQADQSATEAMVTEIKQTTKKKKREKPPQEDQGEDSVVLGDTSSQKKKRRRSQGRELEEEGTDIDVEPMSGLDVSSTTMVDSGTQHGGVDEEGDLKEEDSRIQLDWQALKELKEFIPNVELRSPDEIRRLIKYDLDRCKEFKKQGIPIRRGRYTELENQRITKNVHDFLALTGIDSATKLFFPLRFKDEEASIKKAKALYKFHERLAEGVPRLWHQVYVRGRKMFDGSNYKGRFTSEELQSLKKLQTLHGNNWAHIAELTGRSSAALEKRFSQMATNRGPWSEEEKGRLLKAVKEQLVEKAEAEDPDTIRRDRLYHDLPWKELSVRVRTRHWVQCRSKWMAILKHKIAVGQPVFSGGRKAAQAKVDLIRTLYAMKVEDAADIDWEEVAYTIGNVTPSYVQTHFYRLKMSRVPLWEGMPFCEVIDFLYKNALPSLEQHLQKFKAEPRKRRRKKKKERESPEEEEEIRGDPQELFFLSQIFAQEEEEGFSEVNNVR